MMGVSWGGFNALQVASLKPPALRAIVTVCSSDDRYRDDVHYMGGTLLKAGIDWGSFLLRAVSHPPDPALVGDRWLPMWRQRLENVPLFLEGWMRHQPRDDYWRHGSVCEDYGAIQCPVFAVGGWTDGLHQHDPTPAGAPPDAQQGPDWAVGAWLPPHRASRTPDRISPAGSAMVGSLAEGRGERREGRADAASLDLGERRAGRRSRRTTRKMGCRGQMAAG